MKEHTHLQKAESYSGTIIGIDCRDKITRETASPLIEPSEYKISRIKIRRQDGGEGYELVNFDLPESYVGRIVQVNNSMWRSQNGTVVSRQEVISLGGLESLSILVIAKQNERRKEK